MIISGWLLIVLIVLGALAYLYDWIVAKPKERRERAQRAKEL